MRPTETVDTLDRSERVGYGLERDRRVHHQSPVWPRMVAMRDELGEDLLEMMAAEHERPVETLSPSGAHEALGERVRPWRPHGAFDDPGAFGGEHVVEGATELGVAVADQEFEAATVVGECGGQVAGLLGDPAQIGIGGDAGQEHLASLEPDEEQHVEAPQADSLDIEEVAGEHA